MTVESGEELEAWRNELNKIRRAVEKIRLEINKLKRRPVIVDEIRHLLRVNALEGKIAKFKKRREELLKGIQEREKEISEIRPRTT